MNLDPKRIQKDIRRCDEAIHAAETLLKENLYTESISRAYYSTIHAVMILLAYKGQVTRDPGEAEEKFSPLFLKEYGLEEELFSLFDEIRRAKKSSPQSYLYKYSEEYAREIVNKARDFLDIILKTLNLNE